MLLGVGAFVCACQVDGRELRVASDGGYQFRQGLIRSTNFPTDLAMDGLGFLAVDASGRRQYVRGGHFFFNDEGFFTDPSGRLLLGSPAEHAQPAAYDRLDQLISPLRSPVRATTIVAVRANLDSRSLPLPAIFDSNSPGTTSNFSTSVTVYDQMSRQHQMDIFFRLIRQGVWEWHVLTDGSGLTGGTPGTPTEGTRGQLFFNGSGMLMSVSVIDSGWNFIDSFPRQLISWSFDPLDGGTGLQGLTQFSGPDGAVSVWQDGWGEGFLMGGRVAHDGALEATFSNGQAQTIGYIPVVMFAQFGGLVSSGTDAYVATGIAGPPLPGAPGFGGRAVLEPAALEDAN